MPAVLELRQADDPRVLLGYLPVPAGLEVKVGAVAHFAVGRPEFRRTGPAPAPMQLRLTIGEYWRPIGPGQLASSLAWRGPPMPMSVLRRIPGFVEAHLP